MIRVLVVDDSALVRKILTMGLNKDPNIEVIGGAGDPYQARDMLVELNPDVITLDIEMPKMDGVTFLKRFMPHQPVPTVVLSSLTSKSAELSIQALEAGAVSVMQKPKVGIADRLDFLVPEICEEVKKASRVNVNHYQQTRDMALKQIDSELDHKRALSETTDKVIAIGASTGGVESLSKILPLFPPDSPGIVIVQHLPALFTHSFATRLDTLCSMKVKEAQDGDRVLPGQILIAPGGDQHLEVIRQGGQYRVKLITTDTHYFNVPAIDVMFESVAQSVGQNATAIVMTGMGKDGAKGLLDIYNAKGKTFVQNEETCVINGMPQASYDLNPENPRIPLNLIPKTLLNAALNGKTTH